MMVQASAWTRVRSVPLKATTETKKNNTREETHRKKLEDWHYSPYRMELIVKIESETEVDVVWIP